MREQWAVVVCEDELMGQVHWKNKFVKGEVWFKRNGAIERRDCYLFPIPQPRLPQSHPREIMEIIVGKEGAAG